ncbi:unnamed protein product [Phytophthora lilii]|uniref:Unnamed protein product n=1 Tax=Phytophthora lilii TaxID=2077276 RepID=A0A9W6WWZ1_9STRA|nr:unnamed protein product [Phytophthora lilii]
MRAEPDAPFNPLAALQTLLADVLAPKTRVVAAQQLESYLRLLAPTPTLLRSYEPYLPLLAEAMAAPGKGGPELQRAVLAVLQALAAHGPAAACDWMAGHAQLGHEPWLVQWSYALLLQTEKSVPRQDELWHAAAEQLQELERAMARVMHMWRTLLDHTADQALVQQLVECLQALLAQETDEQWRRLMLKKLQPHFVDIADVFIGWMMSTEPHSPLRYVSAGLDCGSLDRELTIVYA